MQIKHLLLLFILLNCFEAFAQKEANNWYFGSHAGITFNNGTLPTALTNSKMNTSEGCATISTSKGRLLFYTDGINVWDSTHTQMPNGSGLKGNFSSTQSGVIVPRPDSAHIYYIFAVDAVGSTNGVTYSEVNMKLNSGKGDVVSTRKNIKLTSPTSEKITAVKHGNNKDFWMLTTKLGTDTVYAYLITASGVNSIPVRSKTGFKIPTGNIGATLGYMKTSPDGTKLAYANWTYDSTVIADFNSSTGTVSNAWAFGNNDGYGLEFSPKSKYLYVAEMYPPIRILQYDAKATSKASFLSSRRTVDSAFTKSLGAMQVGPDGKIYVNQYGNSYLDVIHAPDSAGKACRPQRNYVSLSGKTTQYGLPTFIQSYFKFNAFDYTRSCIQDTTIFTINNISDLDSVKWDFGDPGSGAANTSKLIKRPFHLYKTKGNYTVKLISFFKTNRDTVKRVVYINNAKPFLGNDTMLCGAAAIFNYIIEPNKGFLTYNWSTGAKTQSIMTSAKGTYILSTIDTNGCKGADTIQLFNPRNKAAFTLSDTALCPSAALKVSNTSVFLNDSLKSVLFSFSDGIKYSDTAFKRTFYKTDSFTLKLTITGHSGCKDSVTKSVKTFPMAKVNFSINADKQCFSGHSFSFTNSSTISNGDITDYQWLFGDGGSDTTEHITGKTYLKDSTYNISLITTSDKLCRDTTKKTVFIYPNPKASFTISKPEQCFNRHQFDFINTSVIRTGFIFINNWALGDGSSPFTKDVYGKTYSKPDSFNVNLLVVSDYGCKDNITQKVVLLPSAKIDFSINKDTQCFKGNRFSFTNNSSISKGTIFYNWNFGDGNTDTSKHISDKQYASYGAYTVRLIATTDKNCSDTLLRTVTVNATPVPKFSTDKDRQCFRGNTFNFTNQSNIAAGSIGGYHWDMGNAQSRNSADVLNYSYLSEDTFSVQMQAVSDKGCRDTLVKTVVTFAQPVAKFVVPNDSQCWQKNYFIIINQTSLKYGKLTHEWDFGDNTGDTSETPQKKQYANSSAGYTIRYKAASEHGCTDSASHDISLLERPLADFSINDTNQCFKGHSFSFANKTTFSVPGTLSYQWHYGDGQSSTGINPLVKTYTQPNHYNVSLIVHSSLTNCYDTMTRDVLAAPHAVPDFTVNKDSQCFRNNLFMFTNASTLQFGNMNFRWHFGDGTQAVTSNAYKTYSSGSNYTITLVAYTENDCKDSVTKTIVLVPHPVAGFNISDSIQCVNSHSFDMLNTTALPYGSYSSNWYFDDGSEVAGKDLTGKKFSSPGWHKTTLAVRSDFGCTDTTWQRVYLEPGGTTTISIAGKDSQCMTDNLFNVSASSSDPNIVLTSWNWSFGDGNSASVSSGSHHYAAPGDYIIKLISISANGCADTVSRPAVVQHQPVSAFTADKPCFPDPVQFKDESTVIGGNIGFYKWDFGDGSEGSGANPVKTYGSPGTYTVKLITRSLSGCWDTVTGNIYVRQKPKALFDFTRLPSSGYELITLQFNNRSTGSIASHYWDFGNDSTGTDINPLVNYNDTGVHTVTLTVTSADNCSDTYRLKTPRLYPDFTFFLPNAFSPNNNNLNEHFKPVASKYVHKYTMEIYNRWGEKLFESNDITKGWDGTYMGQPCEDGAYLCRIYLLPVNGPIQHHEQMITLLR